MLSVNQLNASIKLTELWKVVNNADCPLKITKPVHENPLRQMRTRNDNALVENGVTDIRKSTFLNDGIKLWNSAPVEIKNCKSLYSAKKHINTFVKSLPI